MEIWLSNIDVGTKVIISGSFHREDIDEVVRLTKTQIILKDTKAKFKRSNGFVVGGSCWNTDMLREATDEKIAKIKESRLRKTMIKKIEECDFRRIDTETLMKTHNTLFP